MKTILILALTSLAITTCSSYYANETDQLHESTTELLRTEGRRVARQLNIPGQEYIVRGHSGSRQVIKIPSNSRLKVVQPQQQQSSQRQNPSRRYPQGQHQYASSSNNKNKYVPHQDKPKRVHYDEEDYFDDADYNRPKKPRKTKKGYVVKDVSREEFYEDEELDAFQKKPKQKGSYNYQQNKAKRYKKPLNNKYEYLDTLPLGSQNVERPSYYEDEGYDFDRKNRYRVTEDDPYGYEDYAASSITMKQVAAPNLALSVVDPPDLRKEPYTTRKPNNDNADRYNDFNQPDTRRQPSSRQIQSMFPQQYTTHNPHVTRNLGLSAHEHSGSNIERYHDNMDEYAHVAAASTEHRQTVHPTGSSGIHIVKPPQFRDPQQNGPTTAAPNQRATIRDILLQDCPDAENVGYCASPPRYPTQQINNIMEKCADLMDAIYSPAPLEPEDDLSSFSSRADHDQDIEFVESNVTMKNDIEDWNQWSRSSIDGSNTVCGSIMTQTEPGYAKEVTSNRWFVIMQTMDSIVQRVMTDTCDRPGKPCAGLAGLKCSRSANPHHSYKATRCVQRYSQQRLISWDPELPHACPKVRVFRFPTACLCHLSVD